MVRKAVATKEAVSDAVEELSRESLDPTVERVRVKLQGGSFSTISKILREVLGERRRDSNAQSDVPPDLLEIARRLSKRYTRPFSVPPAQRSRSSSWRPAGRLRLHDTPNLRLCWRSNASSMNLRMLRNNWLLRRMRSSRHERALNARKGSSRRSPAKHSAREMNSKSCA